MEITLLFRVNSTDCNLYIKIIWLYPRLWFIWLYFLFNLAELNALDCIMIWLLCTDWPVQVTPMFVRGSPSHDDKVSKIVHDIRWSDEIVRGQSFCRRRRWWWSSSNCDRHTHTAKVPVISVLQMPIWTSCRVECVWVGRSLLCEYMRNQFFAYSIFAMFDQHRQTSIFAKQPN